MVHNLKASEIMGSEEYTKLGTQINGGYMTDLNKGLRHYKLEFYFQGSAKGKSRKTVGDNRKEKLLLCDIDTQKKLVIFDGADSRQAYQSKQDMFKYLDVTFSQYKDNAYTRLLDSLQNPQVASVDTQNIQVATVNSSKKRKASVICDSDDDNAMDIENNKKLSSALSPKGKVENTLDRMSREIGANKMALALASASPVLTGRQSSRSKVSPCYVKVTLHF
jgi:hypothetical protein